MNISDLREKRNKLMSDASELASKQTPEARTSFDAMIADVDAIDADITRLERVAKFESEERTSKANRPNPSNPEERATKAKEDLRHYMLTGERRDMTVAGQGVLIPQLFDPAIVNAEKSYGQIYNLVNVMKTDNGNPIKLPLSNDTTNGLVSQTVGTDAAEVDITTSSVTIQVDNFSTGVIKVDNGLLSDAGFDLESWIRDRFAERFYRGASSLIVNGDSANVASLTAAYASTGFTSNTTAAIKYVDFATALGTLDPAYLPNSAWIMNNSTLASVIGLTDSNGRPLFLPEYGDGSMGFAGTILGRPVKIVTQLANIATGAVPIFLGDYRAGYTFRQQGQGLGILRLNERYAAGYETGFVGFARLGGVATDAGTHPVIGITIK